MSEERYLAEYYGNYNEDERLLCPHGSVEFLTTARYIDRYLRREMKILEVGAGTGRYSLHYANQGYDVTSIELIEHNIDVFKSKIQGGTTVSISQGNACDLSMINDNAFDITLVLGPLYHLFTDADKRKAVSEALRVTKQGGILFFAYLTHDSVIIDWGLAGRHLVEGIQQGIITNDFKCKSKPELIFEMFHVEEFDKLMSEFRTEHLHTVAQDGMSLHFRDKIDALDDEMFSAWLTYHYSTCERKDLVGYSNHVLYIGRKK
jgi:SAM-dependent methyltransferase